MSISLYRKYRPQDFKSIVGQKAAVEVLKNSIEKSRVGHAYLFSGSRGCGKTSTARIFAKALNCLEPVNFEPCGNCKNCTSITAGENLDVIEIDGASNNSVDEIRELKTHVTLAPFNSKYKIYIIDEVHMLSTAAFNALLKTLEEPPDYVIFILATTEPHKVPVTIRSRCQHIPFHSINTEDIFSRLDYVCKSENISASSEALWEISRQADGALRDALSILEQVISASNSNEQITLENVESILGAGSRPAFEKWITLLRTDFEKSYTDLKNMFDAGASASRIFEEIFSLMRNLWLVNKFPGIVDSLGISEQEKDFLKNEAKYWQNSRLHYILNTVLKILTNARAGIRADILLGMLMLELDPDKPKIENADLNTQVKSKIPQIKTQIEIPQEIQQTNKTESKTESEDTDNTPNDETLKNNLLGLAHEKNFVIYCALIYADFYERDGVLFLRFKEPYSYETLKLGNYSSILYTIFQDNRNFANIVLKYFGKIFQCPKPLPKLSSPNTAVQTQNTEKNSDFIIPEEIEKDNSQNQDKQKSAFDSILSDFAKLNIKSEIVLMHRKTLNNNEQDNDSNEEDND